jgi:NAD-dependent SIR2 family protein deacetylase
LHCGPYSKEVWKTHSGLANAQTYFLDIPSPEDFRDARVIACAPYGHRLAMCPTALFYPGFDVMCNIGDGMAHGKHVLTSTVDVHFQRAGFPAERVKECHGTAHLLNWLQPR